MIRARKPGLILPKKRELLTRRSLLRGLGATVCAPAVVRAQSIGGESGLHGGKVKSGGGGGGYVAKAVHFDGSTYLSTASLSATDNGFYSCSLWLNPSDLSQSPMVYITDPSGQFGPYFTIFPTGGLRYFLCNTGDANDFSFRSADGTVSTGAWINLLFTANVNLPDPDKILVLYINDMPITNTGSSSDIAFTVASNALAFFLGSDTQGENYIGDMADVWVAPGVSLLTGADISVATRRKFISASGKPVNPTGFPAGGAVLFSGDAATFANNQLPGGSFATTGTLTNATTSPSD